MISALKLEGQEFAGHVDMGRIVGVSDVISVNDGDEIVYAVRRNRDADGLVPFVKNRKGDACPYIAVHLVPQHDGTYLLSSAWIGMFGGDDEPFPLAPDATPRSKEYWDAHAFVHGSQGILPGTETTRKPW